MTRMTHAERDAVRRKEMQEKRHRESGGGWSLWA